MLEYDRGRALFVSQADYIESMLKRFDLEKAYKKKVPISKEVVSAVIQDCTEPDQKSAVVSLDEPSDKVYPTRQAVGCLMWLANTTRPDICFAVNFLASFVKYDRSSVLWEAIQRVMLYLSGTRHYALRYGSEGSVDDVRVYTDSSFADLPERRGTSGEATTVGGALVAWKSRKQHLAARSTMESEWMALADAVRDLNFIRFSVLVHHNIIHTYKHPLPISVGLSESVSVVDEKKSFHSVPDIDLEKMKISVLVDNTAVIHILKDRAVRERVSRQLDIRFHYVVDRYEENCFSISYIPSSENIADLFTKPLACTRHRELVEKFMRTS